MRGPLLPSGKNMLSTKLTPLPLEKDLPADYVLANTNGDYTIYSVSKNAECKGNDMGAFVRAWSLEHYTLKLHHRSSQIPSFKWL